MNFMFHDLIGHLVEIYIDDVVVKSVAIEDHVPDLRDVLQRDRKIWFKDESTQVCLWGIGRTIFGIHRT